MKVTFKIKYNLTNKKCHKCLLYKRLWHFYSFILHKMNKLKTANSSPKIPQYNEQLSD